MELNQLVLDYLKSCNYQAYSRGDDFIVGSKPSQFEDVVDTVIVWTPNTTKGTSFASQEGPYISRFARAVSAYPTAKKFMLVRTLSGLSMSFRQQAHAHGVSIRVPIQFFDTPFKIEETKQGDEAYTAARELSGRGDIWLSSRVHQPCSTLNKQKPKEHDDLLEILLREIENKNGSKLNIIIGPAGVGKTVLFESLFSVLYKKFIDSKNKQQLFPRPLPLIPQYIRSAVARSVDGLLDSFLRTEFLAPIEKDTFIWMILNGYGIWLIDGLDELIDRDPTFFSTKLVNILHSKKQSEPAIILSIRDSLLSTNDDIKDFLDEYQGSITIYELTKWDMKTKIAFSKTRFKNPQLADGFIKLLKDHKDYSELSNTPYYCKLISDDFETNTISDFSNESAFLHHAVQNILKREYGKDLLDSSYLPIENLTEVLQDLASEDAANHFSGITTDIIREYTEIVVKQGCDQQTLDKLIVDMKQLAVFSKGNTGQTRFSQEIIAQHLWGEKLVRSFRNNKDIFLNEISNHTIPANWVTLRTVANMIDTNTELDPIIQMAQQPAVSDQAFRNILQIVAFSDCDTSFLKKLKPENRDLTGLIFARLDFEGTCFRQANLTDVIFNGCTLKNCLFEGAILNRTKILINRDEMKGAKFGNLERMHSIINRVNGNELDFDQASTWLSNVTGVKEQSVDPCKTALQLRFLFSKFLRPDGSSKRLRLDTRSVLITPNQHINPRIVLESTIRHSYLFMDTQIPDCVNRCDGQRLGEMSEFVNKLRLSDGLRRLLNELCDIPNCTHSGY